MVQASDTARTTLRKSTSLCPEALGWREAALRSAHGYKGASTQWQGSPAILGSPWLGWLLSFSPKWGKGSLLGSDLQGQGGPSGRYTAEGSPPYMQHTQGVLGPSRLRERREEERGPQCPSGILAVTPQPALTKSQRLSLRLQVLSQLFIRSSLASPGEGDQGAPGQLLIDPGDPSVAVLAWQGLPDATVCENGEARDLESCALPARVSWTTRYLTVQRGEAMSPPFASQDGPVLLCDFTRCSAWLSRFYHLSKRHDDSACPRGCGEGYTHNIAPGTASGCVV